VRVPQFAFVRGAIRITRFNLRKGYILPPEARRTIGEALTAFRHRRARG
jgi:hypothetical protein